MKILLTRPREWGQSLCDQLKTLGHQVDWIPVIHYQPSAEFSLETAIFRLQQSHIAIFISQAAVRFAKPVLEVTQRYWPSIQWLAIGESTALALRQIGIPQVLTSPGAPYDSESLLKLPILQTIQGKTITILKGEGGRALLDTILQLRGAMVYPLNLYQRTLPVINERFTKHLGSWTQNADVPDLSIVTSAEALNNYRTIFASHLSLLQKKPIIVVGQRLWKIAKELGFEKPLLALGADDQNVLQVICAYTP
jgi:uroporphyrinogen-III synthase